jgi:hypothetical protein
LGRRGADDREGGAVDGAEVESESGLRSTEGVGARRCRLDLRPPGKGVGGEADGEQEPPGGRGAGDGALLGLEPRVLGGGA